MLLPSKESNEIAITRRKKETGLAETSRHFSLGQSETRQRKRQKIYSSYNQSSSMKQKERLRDLRSKIN